ncbi:hypothetical protein R50072_36890 [Simiduia litorea]
MLLEAVAKEWNRYLPAAIALVLTLIAASVNWTESLTINLLNYVGFVVWFFSAVIAIIFLRAKSYGKIQSEHLVFAVGAISWAGFSKVPYFLGSLFGV